MLFAELAIIKKNKKVGILTYHLPRHLEKTIAVGSLVTAPLRKKSLTAIVTRLNVAIPAFPTREIAALVARKFLFPWQIQLAQFISDYYFCTINESIGLFLPPNINSVIKNSPLTSADNSKKPQIPPNLKKLTPKQQKIITEIETHPQLTHLIHGITGSGKTEIYLRLAKKTTANNGQTLILVPEISLTPQLIEYFETTFENEIAVIHSRLSTRTRTSSWLRIKNQTATLIIGSRSALFAPFKNLKTIIIDEEHEWSYKQENAPRYHAKTVAQELSKITGSTLILGSATPSTETYYQASQNNCLLHTLTDRIKPENISQPNELPLCHIIDLRLELLKKNFSIFSEFLTQKIAETLEKKKQIILFLNRRGAGSQIVCRTCGNSIKCQNCDISLVTHKNAQKVFFLMCHYCGLKRAYPIHCPNCQSPHIKTLGIGTQKIEEELQKIFPFANIIRADRDSTQTKAGFSGIYRQFKNHQADILIGTQMITKGLDIPNVELAGIILADLSLHIPHFRSEERTFQMLMQVAGRAGRRDTRGEVIIQTYLPENRAIQAASHQDYQLFYNQEVKIRTNSGYPPFNNLITLTYSRRHLNQCLEATHTIEQILQTRNHSLGNLHNIVSAPAIPHKIANKYRYQILLRGPHPRDLINNLPELKNWKIDVDPI